MPSVITDTQNNGNVTGAGNYVSGFVGCVYGDSRNIIEISDSINNGAVSGVDFVGGFIGGFGTSTWFVETPNLENTGDVSGRNNVGGFIGGTGNSSGYSNHTQLLMENGKNSGNISGNNYVGGMVGNHDSYMTSISLAYTVNTGDITGNEYVGGVFGRYNDYFPARMIGNEGDITGNRYVGGVIGRYECKGPAVGLAACYNTGSVTANVSDAAGIIGTVSGTNCLHKGCLNVGEISAPANAGQIITQAYDVLSYCYALETDGIDKDYYTVTSLEELASMQGAWMLDGGDTGERLDAWTYEEGSVLPTFATAESGAIYGVTVEMLNRGAAVYEFTKGTATGKAGQEIEITFTPGEGDQLYLLECSMPEGDRETYGYKFEDNVLSFTMPYNVTVTATFASEDIPENALMMTFDANGGTFADGSDRQVIFVEEGAAVTVPTETPVYGMYEFHHWYYENKTYDATNPNDIRYPEVISGETVLDEATTILASWQTREKLSGGGSGTEDDPYIIQDAADMHLLKDLVGKVEGYIGYKYYQIAEGAEITLKSDWGNGIYHFTGDFDGNGATINISAGNGIFNGIEGDADIHDLTVNANISNSFWIGAIANSIGNSSSGDASTVNFDNVKVFGSVRAQGYAGGLVGSAGCGWNNGAYSDEPIGPRGTINISNCHNYASITATRGYTLTAESSAGHYVGSVFSLNVSGAGGLIGETQCYCVIEDSSNQGPVNGTEYGVGGLVGDWIIGEVHKSYNTGTITGGKMVGGLVGSALWLINGDSERSQRTVWNSYNTGKLVGEDYVGGIMGYGTSEGYCVVNPNINNCYNSGEIDCDGENYGGMIADRATIADSYTLNSAYNSDYDGDGVGKLAAEDFASGYAAWLLDQDDEGRRNMWTQNVLEGYPAIGAPQVYRVFVQMELNPNDDAKWLNYCQMMLGQTDLTAAAKTVYLLAGESTQPLVATGGSYNPDSNTTREFSLNALSMDGNAIENESLLVVPEVDDTVLLAEFTYEDTVVEEDTDDGDGTGEGSGTGEGTGTGTGTGEGTGVGDGQGDGQGTGDADEGSGSGDGSDDGEESSTGTGEVTVTDTSISTTPSETPTEQEPVAAPVDHEVAPEVEQPVVEEPVIEEIEEPAGEQGGSLSGGEGDEESEDEEESEPTPMTVFEIVKQTIQNNPLLTAFILMFLLAVIAASGYNRYRRSKK